MTSLFLNSVVYHILNDSGYMLFDYVDMIIGNDSLGKCYKYNAVSIVHTETTRGLLKSIGFVIT